MGETLNLTVCVDKLSKLWQGMNNCTSDMQTDSISLLKKYMEIAKNKFNNLDKQIENSKTSNIFVSLFSKLFSLFSKKDVSEKLSEETFLESTTEKQQVVMETKKSLINKLENAKKSMDNKDEIDIDNNKERC